MTHERYQACIDACNRCAQACFHCAAACLQEPDVQQMTECIRLDLDCAEVCRLASSVMSRGSDCAPQVCALCAEICIRCGDECARHPMDHCQECARVCRECARICRTMA